MHLDTPNYTIAEVALAVGIPVGSLRALIQRGHFKLIGSDRQNEIDGMPRFVTLRRALQWGVAARLMALGFHPARAADCARAFSDISNDLEDPKHKRDPGELFSTGYTFLLAYREADDAKVIRIDDTTKAFSVFLSGPRGRGRANEGSWVFVDDVDHAVRSGLQQLREAS